MTKAFGFTLIEILITLAVIAITLSLIVPSFSGTIQNNRAITQTNTLVSAINLARSEAVKRSGNVTVCASSDQSTCTVSSDWSTGWIVFSDMDDTNTVTTGDAILRVWPALEGSTVLSSTSSDTYIKYRSNGRISNSASVYFSLTVPNCTGDNVRKIQVSTLGRIRQLAPTAC